MSAYTAAHADPQGAGDARPTALQVIEDEGLQGKLTGKIIVITGATSGIVGIVQHIYMSNMLTSIRVLKQPKHCLRLVLPST